MAPADEDPVTLRLRIAGRVQGVGYRFWATGAARQLGVTGWVRNLTDGSVEALAHGTPNQVDAFVTACREGPVASKVTAVETRAERTPYDGSGFEQKPTSNPD